MLWTPPARAAGAPAGAHLTFGADPARAMALSWSTPQPVRGAVVDLGLDRTYGLTLPAESTGAPLVDTIYHHVRADSLEPGQLYHYRLRHDGGEPFTGTFRTAAAESGGFTFVAFGDMGVGAAAQSHITRIAAADPAFAFVVGDLCYADMSGGTALPAQQDPARWDAWLAQIQPSAARVPWMTTVGNHEMERGSGELGYQGYLSRFTLPGTGAPDGPATYSFRYQNVGLISLDGNDASYEIDRNRNYLGHHQDTWFAETLSAMRADERIDFIVVGFHNCMYCTNAVHGSDGGIRDRWGHLFDEHSVDLVVNGHNHCYERTHPMRSGRPVAEAPVGATVDSASGTTYLTAGGGGQAEYPTSTRPASYVVDENGVRVPETAEWSAVPYMGHSIAVIDVEPAGDGRPATMTITGVAVDGTRFDTVTLQRTR
nr:metallophosphoesterase family protein [Pseudonocardia sp. C8]